MLHLDIKPDNIAINDDESAYNVCFVDFGLARKRVTPPEEDFIGTAGFVPPEFQLTPKTDVFALLGGSWGQKWPPQQFFEIPRGAPT